MKQQQGFTLIEIIVYSGIMVAFVTTALLSLQQMLGSSDRVKQQRELNENHRFLVQKLNWALSNVQVINSPAAGANAASISINQLNFSSNPIVLDLSGGVMRVATGGGPAMALSNGYVTISNLLFSHEVFDFQSAIHVTGLLSNSVATSALDNWFYIK
ncbi:MAG TPA: type II secretion system protein [Candidatus Paceibacterota bacterium]